MTQNRADHFDADALVIGSGFGGAVAAARLAQAGLAVTVLERGRRWGRGSFPRSTDLRDGWLWQHDFGLYDIRWLDDMAAAQAAGWGGGSLIYANVFARPPQSITEQAGWPPELDRTTLNPYYDLAAHMLEVRPVGDDPTTGRPPERTELFERIVGEVGPEQGIVRPNLAVRFGVDTKTPHRNLHGAQQWNCSFVGDCIAGCNQGAKNSLDYNYLHLAERHGARAITGAEVIGIAPVDDHQLERGYRVRYRRHAFGHGHGHDQDQQQRPDDHDVHTLTVPIVILAAGAVASTELLLRAQHHDRTLPALSPLLGHGYSGNGDALALGHGPRDSSDLTRGPTITTTTVLDVMEGPEPVWFQVQDGGYAAPVRRVIDASLPARRLRQQISRLRRHSPEQRFAVLSMGSDTGTGRLVLDHHGEAAVRWDKRSNRRLYRAQARVNPAVSRVLGRRVTDIAPWTVERKNLTVHSLGGVPIGATAEQGVVNTDGAVHGYPGLYVMDGASIPAPTGVNPSATILAITERRIERLVRSIGSDPNWRAPEWPDVTAGDVPEDRAAASMAARRTDTRGDGIRFTERMSGTVGGGRGSHWRLLLHGEIPGFEAYREDPIHPAKINGTITVDHDHQFPVDGTLSFFPDHDHAVMRYRLSYLDATGTRRQLTGAKLPVGRGPLARWRAVTVLTLEDPADAATSQPAELRMSVTDVVRLVLSVRGIGFTRPRRLRVLLCFAASFLANAIRRSGA